MARSGDTLASVAARVGTSTGELARKNALPDGLYPEARRGAIAARQRCATVGCGPGYRDREPSRSAGPQGASAAIDGKPAPAEARRDGHTEPLIDPVRHRVEAGETAYSIARLYGVSVTALASWNGLGSDLAVRENQELLIPIVGAANRIDRVRRHRARPGNAGERAVERGRAASGRHQGGRGPRIAESRAQRTPQGGRLTAPVSGTVSRRYDPANPNGIGFAVPAGTPVKAAAPGEVALISEALGGLGTIVLVGTATT